MKKFLATSFSALALVAVAAAPAFARSSWSVKHPHHKVK